MDLKRVVNGIPKSFRREDLQHRGLDHVIFESTIDQRRGDVRHRFHRINIRRHARDFFLHQIEITQRLFELFSRVRVFDGES